MHETFAAYRPLLFSVAYRMLGSATEAEDVVQEAWLRLAGAEEGRIRDLRAYLVQVVTRLCLDQLKSARARRERYVGPWLPQPVLTGPGVGDDPLAAVERRDLLDLGALLLLERLSPQERAVLVLREALELSHAEIAETIGVSEAAARQHLTRARRRLAQEGRRGGTPDPQAHRKLVVALRVAFETGDVQPLIGLLRADVVLVSDTGGEARAPRRPIAGRDKVLRFALGVRGRGEPGLAVVETYVNGLPGLVFHVGGTPAYVMTCDVVDGVAARLLLVAAPGKLGYVAWQLAG
ncbi:RNA polymerase sigma factor SigJ [Carbonactinospora thermoautotrophica]|uniref:RNA polymerase sigma factor SigJ n=1 Tax=Carbonactinospora thermoautotrophica TaxID=1469144 RepID=UPI002270F795|nr:RNA polymerase sigma factor SigJ [Carbonactinospora thermoautotrophica]